MHLFDFLSSDWFTIVLEIAFLIFIIYDIKKYRETKKKEYITNIALTVVFAVWTLLPFYNSYVTWSDASKEEVISTCQKDNNETLCNCISDGIFKEYSFDDYKTLDKNSSDYREFIAETEEDCLDDSWF